MSARTELKRSFAGVPVGLKLLGGPMNPSSPAIFQMNVQQSRRFGEYFQIWPGDRGNEIEVLSVDPVFTQLLLRVKEARRRFVEVVEKRWGRTREDVEARARASGGQILQETRYDWRLEMWTPDVERRYLCGRDDVRLFIAQVRDGHTVAEAHESLKPDEVRRAEALAPGSVRRQGEWFFLPPSEEESDRLRRQIQERNRAVRLGAAVGDGGRPHVADYVVGVDRRTRSRHREYRRPEVYARGAVLHPDHRRLWLEDWRKVVRNREIGEATAARRLRIRWID